MAIYPYKKNGKTYYRIKVYLGTDPKTGKEMRTTKSGFTTMTEARIAEGQLLQEGAPSTDRVRFKEVWGDWLALYKLRVKESSYNITKRRMENHLIPLIGDYYVDAIKLKDVQTIVNDWSERFVRFGEMKRYMSSIFDEAERQGIIRDNPCRLIVMPNPKKTEDFEEAEEFENFYNKDELKSFLEAIKPDDQWHAFFRLLAFSGIRRGEALALKWSDLSGSTLSITKTLAHGEGNALIVQPPKTPKSKRTVQLDRETVRVLKEWRKFQISLCGIIPYMFANEKKAYFAVTKPAYVLKRLYDKNPDLKKISTHGFRHTHCSMMFESGATMLEVQKRLGHANISTTMNIYAHVTKEKRDEAVDRLAGYLGY